MDIPPADTPVVCDPSTAQDTAEERLAEYRRLFGAAMVARERTPKGIRFVLRADDGIEAWVRDLAAREKACCAFFAFDVSTVDGQVRWDVAVIDDPAARAILEEFYALPDTATEDVTTLTERYVRQGLRFTGAPSSLG